MHVIVMLILAYLAIIAVIVVVGLLFKFLFSPVAAGIFAVLLILGIAHRVSRKLERRNVRR